MQRLRIFLANWLGFSRTEVNGFLVLIPLMIVLIASEPVYRAWQASRNEDFTNDQKILDSLIVKLNVEKLPKQSVQKNIFKTSRFDFDPNTVTENDLQKLGFSKNLSTRIANYRQKGGVFRVKRDLLKIHGIDSTLYHQLYANILLPEEVVENKNQKIAYSEKVKNVIVPFDINKADTAQLNEVQGIGNVLAARIVKFRDRLGGFIVPDQIAEVYGLDSVVVQRLKRASYVERNFVPQKLNLNTADEEKLISHPYIKKSFAKAILAYRFQHGKFTDVRDLTKIASIPAPQAERLIPYFKVED